MSDLNQKDPASSDGSCSQEPVSKRTRSASKIQMEKPEPEHPEQIDREPNILDLLNEDCWRTILDYVSVREIVRSERVSKRWQSVVHRYLLGVRLCVRTSHSFPKPKDPLVKCRILKIALKWQIGLLKKYGPAIVSSDCKDERILRALGRLCRNLEDLRLYDAQYHKLQHRTVQIDKLRLLFLDRVLRFKDAHISKLIGFPTLEQLKIYDNQMMTGCCLSDLKANLKTLQLSTCRRLDMAQILPASHRLVELTKLELSCNRDPILRNVYKLLEKTPNLEYLGLDWYEKTKVGGLVEAISQLTKLKHLSLKNNLSVRDRLLETVGRCCKELSTLDIGSCNGVTAAGVLAVCRGAGETLTVLGVSHNVDLTDDDIARCVAYCPKLELMDLSCCRGVSRELPARVASGPRQRPLRLQLWSTLAYVARELYHDMTFPDLILDFRVSLWNCHNF